MPAKVKKPRAPSKPIPDKPTKKKPGESAPSNTPFAKIDTSRPASDYARLDELLALYTQIDKAALTLPLLSAMPFVKFFWSVFKFYFAVIGDIFLIIPINIVVFIRNIFPGRWSYKSFSWPYLKAAVIWVWRGEPAWAPFICVRPFVVGLLHWHFRSRLTALRRRILLESGFAGDGTVAPIAKIDRAIELWQPQTTFKSLLYTWVLPLVGPVTWLWNLFFPASFSFSPLWTRYALLLSLSWALGILATAFLVKRGLMLGATGQSAYYPGFLPGRGAYAQEEETLNAFGLATSEFPLDFAIVFGSIVLGILTTSTQAEVMHALNTVPQEQFELQESVQLKANIAGNVVWIGMLILAWTRRKKLGRV